MQDLRYIALTVMAVFLALATGLLLGSALNSPDRMNRIYNGLQAQFDGLRQENQRADDENKILRLRVNAREQANRELLPLAVGARLPGATVGIVLCGSVDDGPFRSTLEDTLRAAGAQIGAVVRVPDRLRRPSPDGRRQFEQAWGGTQAADPDPLDPAAWVVRAIHRGANPEQWEQLERETGIDELTSNGQPIRYLLVLTAADDDLRIQALSGSSLPEFKVVETALSEQMRVVGAEPEGTRASVVDALARRNIPTVDNVDTASGQIAVVLTLAGADGRFGSKPGAASPIPQLENR